MDIYKKSQFVSFKKFFLGLIFSCIQVLSTLGMEERNASLSAAASSSGTSVPLEEDGPSSGSSALKVSAQEAKEEVEKAIDEKLSPTCRSLVEKGCEDARVYRRTLNLATYNGEEPTLIGGTIADDWHRVKARALMDICKVLGKSRKQKNLALVGLRLIYKAGGEIHTTEIMNLPPVFISGENSKIIRDPGSGQWVNEINSEGELIHLESMVDQFKGNEVITKESFRTHLMDIYTYAQQNTKLSQKSLKSWQEGFNKEILVAREERVIKSDFLFLNYYHSEQVLLQHLIRKASELCTELREFLLGPKDKIFIKRLVIHVVSINEMCRNCAITYFLSLEQGILKDIFQREFKNLGLNVLPDFSFLTEVSGLKIFDRPKESHLSKQRIAQHKLIDILKFPPHICHYLLEGSISDWNVQELGIYSPEVGRGYASLEERTRECPDSF